MFNPEKGPNLYENKLEQDREKTEKLREDVSDWLTLPEKTKEENPDRELPKKLGDFLIKNKCIEGIGVWRGSWGFKYENGTIHVSENPMPDTAKDYYIFKLPSRLSNGKETNLFPINDNEIDIYRFLHETSHAYQEHLMKKESPDTPQKWYDRVLLEGSSKIDSTLGILFEFCKKKREQSADGKGLSTWGNVPDYNRITHQESQFATRAIEDANELVTMYLWNPNYFETYIDYLSLSSNVADKGYNERNLDNDKLIKITEKEADAVKELVHNYVEEMKNEIAA